jgi:hypothetical protein
MADFDADECASDLQEMEAGIAQTVTIDGEDYACVAGEVTLDEVMEDLSGYTGNMLLRVTVRQSLFTTLPVIGNQLTHGGRTFRIVGRELDPDGLDVAVNLVCEEITA